MLVLISLAFHPKSCMSQRLMAYRSLGLHTPHTFVCTLTQYNPD